MIDQAVYGEQVKIAAEVRQKVKFLFLYNILAMIVIQ
jgi:hypothetical protein